MRITTSQARAFTLLELMLVVAISGVLAMMAIPRYGSSLTQYRATLAAQRIVADLTLVQARARSMGATRSITFNAAQHSYTLTGEVDPERSTATYSVLLSSRPYMASIVSVSFGGTPTLSFNGFGVPSQAGTIVVRSGNVQKTITLEAVSGETSIQ